MVAPARTSAAASTFPWKCRGRGAGAAPTAMTASSRHVTGPRQDHPGSRTQDTGHGTPTDHTCLFLVGEGEGRRRPPSSHGVDGVPGGGHHFSRNCHGPRTTARSSSYHRKKSIWFPPWIAWTTSTVSDGGHTDGWTDGLMANSHGAR